MARGGKVPSTPEVLGKLWGRRYAPVNLRKWVVSKFSRRLVRPAGGLISRSVSGLNGLLVELVGALLAGGANRLACSLVVLISRDVNRHSKMNKIGSLASEKYRLDMRILAATV